MKKEKRSWNKQYGNVKMACWNPWGLCHKRFKFCQSMRYDALGLSELHNVQNKRIWKRKNWITSEDAPCDEQGRCTDPAAGVGILLSDRFADNILAQGAEGSRIVWVRVKGPVCPLFIICVYIPHKYKTTTPSAEDVLKRLDALLRDCAKIKKTDCVILMGDFNCELQRNVQGCTGQWFMNRRPDDGHSDKVMDLLRVNDLFAVDSMFKPKRTRMFCSQGKRLCNATYLQKDSSKRPKKLDYFMVSNRWRSCVTNSVTKWAPSIHRFGRAFDHALLQIDWKWRLKADKRTPAKDYKGMTKENWEQLGERIKDNLQRTAVQKDTGGQTNEEIQERVERMNAAISDAVRDCVPDKDNKARGRRRVSERTRKLYEQRAQRFSKIVAQGGEVTKSMRKRWQRKICNSNLEDYNSWLEEMTKQMEVANGQGDMETVYKTVRIISGSKRVYSNTAPAVDAEGKRILDPEELSKVWKEFLQGKFSETDLEKGRKQYDDLGPKQGDEPLTEQAFVRALIKIKTGKACGPDGIPSEVFKNCEAAARELYEVLSIIWKQEYVPPVLIRASFIMIFKGGNSNDYMRYRCLGLLPHSYKILSLIMLERLQKECSSYLADWQAGFRAARGCRDNILLLRLLFDQVIENGDSVCVTFIDYTAAFDTVSHRCLDESLKRAGASRKTRAMFRAIYAAANGVARVNGLHGKKKYSKSFTIRRGVIQGDIISPMFFILAMEYIFRMHDSNRDGYSINEELKIKVLGYADDVNLVSPSTQTMSKRATSVATGSKRDGDMSINKKKTKNMHVEVQEKLSLPTVTAIKAMEATYKHECEFCGRRCKTAGGLKVHKAACNRQHGLSDKEYEVREINAVFGWYARMQVV